MHLPPRSGRPAPVSRRDLRRKRRRRREQVQRALLGGLIVQAAFLAVALLALDVGRGLLLLLPRPVTSLLALLAVLGPCWAGGLAAGWLGPPLRPRHLAAAALPAAVCFFVVTAGPVAALPGAVFLRFWVAADMLLGFLLAGWIGQRFRPMPRPRVAVEEPEALPLLLEAGRRAG